MGVPVDPQCHPVAAHQVGEVAGECARHRPQLGQRRPSADERRVMGDDDRRAVVGPGEPDSQPAAAGQMDRARVQRCQHPVGRVKPDVLVVVDDPGAHRHRRLAPVGAVELEVAPQRAAEEAHAADHDRVVLEHPDRRARRRLAQLADQPRHGVTVELVVAGQEQHRPLPGP